MAALQTLNLLRHPAPPVAAAAAPPSAAPINESRSQGHGPRHAREPLRRRRRPRRAPAPAGAAPRASGLHGAPRGVAARSDFSAEPAFSWIRKLPADIRTAIHYSKILFCNGYAFDEFFPDVIVSSIDCAIDGGTTVFFDPGPRGRSLSHGNLDEQRALKHALKLSDILLLISDEAESLTNIKHPIQAEQELLRRGIGTKQVIIKMGSKGSIMITENTVSCAPSFKIDAVDTVGCGDSFTAAIAFGFLHDLPAVSTLNAVGAATATGCGAGRNVAYLDKVLQLLREANLNEANLNEEDTAWSVSVPSRSVPSHADFRLRQGAERVSTIGKAVILPSPKREFNFAALSKRRECK